MEPYDEWLPGESENRKPAMRMSAIMRTEGDHVSCCAYV